MAKLIQLVVDCAHPAGLARFWAEALDDFEILPYDDDEVARLASLGLTPETDPTVILVGPGLELCFQQVDVVDIPKKPMTWMRDPAGNDFCVVDDRGPR